MAEIPQLAAVSRPRGTFATKVDEKGRLKLSAEMQKYLDSTGVKRVFVTSLDKKSARIYPIPVWEQQEELLNQAGEYADIGSDMLLRANYYGQETDVDSTGRLVLPAKTRRLLGLENTDVQLLWMKGHIRVFSDAAFEEMLEKGSQNPEADVKLFERQGLQ